MEIQEVGTLQLPEEIVQPFTICNVGETVVVCAKDHTLVLQLKYKHFVDEGAINYELSRIKCSAARPTGELLAHETSLYNGSEIEQRKQIMLDQTIFPNVAKVYINNIQSWISPPGAFEDNANEHLIANLTNMGQLTIYRQEEEWVSNWNPYADVSASWTKHIYSGHVVETFPKLKEMVDDILITCFCWQDKVHQYPIHFVLGTKSGKIVLCSLLNREPRIDCTYQQLETAFLLKYVSMNSKDHFVLAGLGSGRVALYRFEAPNASESFAHIGTFFEEDLTVSAIECEVDSTHERLLMLVAKGSYLLVRNASFAGKVVGNGMLDLEHFMITGMQQLESCKYFVSTMEGAIFLINIDRTPDGALKLRQQEVKSDLNVGSYALYGVTATRSRSCWLFLGYPSRRFDHLSLRTPTSVFITKFNLREAIKVLQNNQTFKMAGYYDAAEMVRYIGSKNIETLKELEHVDLQPDLSDTGAYQLKLQLIQLSAKITHHTRRSKATTEILHNQFQYMCTLIEVISACKVLSYLAELAKRKPVLNPPQQNAVLCLRNFVRSIAEDTFPGDYEYMHVRLKPLLEKTLQQTACIQMMSYELCSFCDSKISPDRCTCPKDHPVFRCVLTKIQILLDGEESTCDMCQRYSIRPELLAALFENEKPSGIDYGKCCVCDIPFRITS